MASRKSALITGCSAGGIGAGLAEAFQKKGYHVFATVRNPAKAPPILRHAPNVSILTLDVLSAESIAAAVDSVTKETSGRLGVVVNNSGQNLVLPALDLDIEDGRKLFDLNFFAPLAVLQAFVPLLIEAQGCVVNQSSAAGYLGMPFLSLYSASKSALLTASDLWRRELEPLGVRTLVRVTTSVKTPAFDNVQMPQICNNSYYAAIRDYLYQLADGRLQDGGMTPLAYGLKVVSEVDKGTVGEIWVGKDAGMSRWAWKLLPKSMMDSMVDGLLKAPPEMAKVSAAMKTQK